MSTAVLQWFKSTYSSDQGGQCLEVAVSVGESGVEPAVHIRDSKNPTGPILRVTPTSWTAFATYVAR
jgi:hypothetical protein